MGEDAELMLAYARRGDVAALSELVRRHERPLMAYLRAAAPSTADAQDAFQEVWFRVIRAATSYHGGSVGSFLAHVARAVVIDRYRRDGRAVFVSLDAAPEEGESAASAELPAEGPDPAQAFASAATAADVLAATRDLPPGQRDVFLLRAEGGLSFKEIAAELRVPLGTVLVWMRRATARLRKSLEGDYGG